MHRDTHTYLNIHAHTWNTIKHAQGYTHILKHTRTYVERNEACTRIHTPT